MVTLWNMRTSSLDRLVPAAIEISTQLTSGSGEDGGVPFAGNTKFGGPDIDIMTLIP